MSNLIKNSFRDESYNDFSKTFTMKDGETPKALLITVDATHAGYVNRNGFKYSAAGMRHAVSKNVWTKPFQKPLLTNHDMKSEPLGRVQAARFISTSDTEGFTQLDILVSDAAAIEKIMDGRYLTVSTHGDPLKKAPAELRYANCSICGENLLLQDEWCGHKRGGIYKSEITGKKEKCFWDIGALDYKEVSIINSPADYNDVKNEAAIITSYAMVDGEEPEAYHTEDNIHRSALIFSDAAVEYATEELMDSAEVKVANSILWEAVGHDKEAYIKAKGLLYKETEEAVVVKDDNKNTQTLEGEEPETAPVIKDEEMESEEPRFCVDWRLVRLSSFDKAGLEYEHAHAVYVEDELGNGYTDYILGHSHKVIDGVIEVSAVPHADKVHNHIMGKDKIENEDKKYILGKSEGHRHLAWTNAAKNGHSSWVDGHNHQIVNGNVIVSDVHEKPHEHKLEEYVKIEAKDLASDGAFLSLKDIENMNKELEDGSDLKNYFDSVLTEAKENQEHSEKLQINSVLKSLELI